MFSINEINNSGNISISVNFNETIVHLVADGDFVKVERFGRSEGCTAEPGNIYDVATNLVREFIKNGTIEAEKVELVKTKMDPPVELLRIRCKTFSATFLESERAKKWLRLVDGPLENLKISGMDTIRGIGRWDQVMTVGKVLVLAACDMTDEEVEGLGATSFALDSGNITAVGAKSLLQKWFLSYSPGHFFQIRFKPTPGFLKTDLFQDLKDVEVSWNEGFRFELKPEQSSGSWQTIDGFYFVADEYHLVKVLFR